MSMGSYQDRTLQLSSRGIIAMLALALAFLLSTALIQPAQAQTYSVLYTFTGEADGGNPYGGVILDATGNLYGTTFVRGNVKGCGLFHGWAWSIRSTLPATKPCCTLSRAMPTEGNPTSATCFAITPATFLERPCMAALSTT